MDPRVGCLLQYKVCSLLCLSGLLGLVMQRAQCVETVDSGFMHLAVLQR